MRVGFEDFSKASDCIKHVLLIAKRAPYGFDLQLLIFTFSYLSSYLYFTELRAKINNGYSSYLERTFGVPQGSILGLLLFNSNICDFFRRILV